MTPARHIVTYKENALTLHSERTVHYVSGHARRLFVEINNYHLAIFVTAVEESGEYRGGSDR